MFELKSWANYFGLLVLFSHSKSEPPETWAGRWFPEKTPKELDNWTGRWFPDRPHPNSYGSSTENGLRNGLDCDDGLNNLENDWNLSPINYTCYGSRLKPDFKARNQIECYMIPKAYKASQVCVSEPIHYDDKIPTFGNYRPLAPQFGEYKFLPVQRWIHSLEQGAVVMLYHPCANPMFVKKLKHIVTECLYRHIIAPSKSLTSEKPFALVTRGCKMTMSAIDPVAVKTFIINYAHKGSESASLSGEYKLMLVAAAKIKTGPEMLCGS